MEKVLVEAVLMRAAETGGKVTPPPLDPEAVFADGFVADCAHRGVQRLHVRDEPPTADSTETQVESLPSVLFGGVPDSRLDDWAHGEGRGIVTGARSRLWWARLCYTPKPLPLKGSNGQPFTGPKAKPSSPGPAYKIGTNARARRGAPELGNYDKEGYTHSVRQLPSTPNIMFRRPNFGDLSLLTYMNMEALQERVVMEETYERKDCDVRAIRWLVDSIVVNHGTSRVGDSWLFQYGMGRDM
ncbi:hypothetical protein V8E53_008581 [Lactarius tabidus]